MVLTGRNDSDRLLASDLAHRIRAASPLIAGVVLSAERDGLVAHVRLDPLLVDARAGQQGLPDRSVAAAASDPRVRRVVEEAILRASNACLPGERIIRHEIAPA